MIAGVILAAGFSERMGRPKALLPMGAAPTTFLEQVVTTLRQAGLETVVVVVGSDAAPIRAAAAAAELPVQIAENPDPARGQLSSLLVALGALGQSKVDAILVAPVDLPLVAAETVKLVLDAYHRTKAPVVRPARGARHGHPVILDRSLFDELRRADLSLGAREVIRAHRTATVDVPVDDEGAFVDIDTPADYEQAFGMPLPRG
jgi:molybdenum cofactor cytidylyltransferase